MSCSGTAGQKSTRPSLQTALTCPFQVYSPSSGDGPTSTKISRCGQVGKVIQTDDIDDGAHHTGVVLGEERRDGVRPGTLGRKAQLPALGSSL